MNTRHHDHPYPPVGTISGQSAGLGWEFVYPLPDEPSHEAFDRDEEPARYDVTWLPVEARSTEGGGAAA